MATPVSIGIDLGASYCCVGTWQKQTVEIIPNEFGERTTPTFVSFSDTECLVGTAAKNQAARNAQNTIYDVLRVIGRNSKYDDPTLQSDMKAWPFKVVRESQDRAAFEVEYKGQTQRFFAEEILAMILKYMQQIAEKYLQCKVQNAVISIPAMFDLSQQVSIETAAKMAGLNVLRIVTAPSLTACSYALQQKRSGVDKEQSILIFDLGGSSLDVSLVAVDDGVIEIKATAGDTHLGGQDFVNLMVDHFAKEFQRKTQSDCSKSHRAMSRLRKQCEVAVRTLSAAQRANIELDSFYNGVDFDSKITRARFEDLCMHYFRQCLCSIERTLQDAKYSKNDVEEVILVGGSSRIPKVQELISSYFDGKKLNKSLHPDEAVAFGAAINAAILSGANMGDAGDMLLLDVTPLSLGIETAGGVMTKLVERNKTIPCKATEKFQYRLGSLSCIPMQTSNNNDDEKNNDEKVPDATPLCVCGRHMERCKAKQVNKRIGTMVVNRATCNRCSQSFQIGNEDVFHCTNKESKEHVPNKYNLCLRCGEDELLSLKHSVFVSVYSGERQLVKDDVLLGQLELKGVPEKVAQRGIEIIFNIEPSRIFTVSGGDGNSEIYGQMTIYPNVFADEEVMKMTQRMQNWSVQGQRHDLDDEPAVEREEKEEEEETQQQQGAEHQLLSENSKLQAENNRLKLENLRLQREMDELRSALKLKGEQVCKLQDDFKELQMELEQEKKRHRSSDYTTWDTQDVLDWIVSIENGRFQRYASSLKVTLRKEEIDGTCLADLRNDDWHRLGIAAFLDKRALVECVQRLTAQQPENAMNYNDQSPFAEPEGMVSGGFYK